MITILERFLRWLAFDARGREVLRETLADWRHEVDQAPGRLAQCKCHVVGVIALTRVLAFLALSSLRGARDDVLVACLLLVLAYSVHIAGWVGPYGVVWQVPSSAVPMLLLSGFPGAAASLAPAALLLAVQRPRRATRRSEASVALAMGSFLVLVLVTGWIAPLSNQYFRETSFAAYGGTGTITHGLAEMTMPQLLAAGSEPAWSRLSLLFVLILSGPTLVLLAHQLRLLPAWSRRSTVAVGVVLYLALAGGGLGWLVPVGAILATAFLAFRTRHPHRLA